MKRFITVQKLKASKLSSYLQPISQHFLLQQAQSESEIAIGYESVSLNVVKNIYKNFVQTLSQIHAFVGQAINPFVQVSQHFPYIS